MACVGVIMCRIWNKETSIVPSEDLFFCCLHSKLLLFVFHNNEILRTVSICCHTKHNSKEKYCYFATKKKNTSKLPRSPCCCGECSKRRYHPLTGELITTSVGRETTTQGLICGGRNLFSTVNIRRMIWRSEQK